MNKSAIILAAGKGTRYGGNKQDVLFHNKPLWENVYNTATKVVEPNRVITVGKDIPGGETRTESVICGLKALPSDTERVIILEAARPLVTICQIRELLNATHPSVSFVRPLVNTVIYRDGTYLNRNELYDLLTPQAFDYHMLLEAYRKGNNLDLTDETRIMYEFYGIKPLLLETHNNLFKVTYPGDMSIIESIYQSLYEERKQLWEETY